MDLKKKKRSSSPEEDLSAGKRTCCRKTSTTEDERCITKRSRSPEEHPIDGKEEKRIRVDTKTPPSLSITNYRLMKELGKGNFGRVMLASYAIKDQLVAVKIMPKKNGKEFKYVRGEAQVLQLGRECPFLCRAFTTFQTQSHLMMVLEYARGGTLESLIKKQKNMNSQKILFYSSEIAVGLQFLHAKGIVHRDLKPENVFLDEQGHIKIGDFGLVCTNTVEHKTLSGIYGTPGYIAPEILSEDPYDAAADWWSFGVIVYEMATGNLPFPPERNLKHHLKTIIYEKPRYPKSLGPELRDLLQQLLKKTPDTRLGVYSNIRDHPFYSSIDWVKVERKQLVPPVKPKMRSVAGLCNRNIPFPKEDPRETSVLENFSYVDPSWQE
ncbi:forkhead box protein D5-C isoform X1 [Xenopus laevis]|uniref:Forkhead box protein D5-C isoform X1 n=2 Tax=Xenopus laevis TaxID=8355 RepID=A0A1L8HY53_XENLA|nr:forkhead box protein D5-C isoform X1 [Xenopus laevis]XP_041442311.1 forkhead box protein D5-C isoform X1 [Xenopus laevis]XP_041442334.1 forkhead box protein D5-C isoform X1 [Xenopus laevis]XP_041442381.1 forkhead box protein D5-C isoform X1 [Xenopus laevis]OCU01080.1 hypothetical protein XELAEV_18006862mg [Xenopus laevis]